MKKFVLATALVAFMAVAAPAQNITFGPPITSHPLSTSPTAASIGLNMAYTMASPGALFVGCATNTYVASKTTAVYINGGPATEVARLTGLSHLSDTTLWYLPDVPAGPANIQAQASGGATHGYGLECFAQAAYGANATDPIETSYNVNTPNLGSGTHTVSCTFVPWNTNDAVLTFEYSTAYNTAGVTQETPFGTSQVTGQFSGLQMAFAHGTNLTYDKPYTQSWTFNKSATSVQVSIITVLLKP
jgi:energy-converting hydrogenase Eha subunit E